MKKVTIDTVKARIAEMENIQNTTTIGISLREEFELACLRQLMAAMDSEPLSQKEPISFDEWSRKCALQITLCYPDFREKAKYIWDSARETQQPASVVPDEKTLRIQGIEALEEFLTETTPEPEMVGGIKLTLTCCRVLKAIIKNNGWADFNGGKPEKVKAETIIAALREPHPDACRAAMLNQAQEPATDNTAQQFEALATSAGSGKQPDSELEKAKRCLPYHLDDRYKVNGSWIGSVQNYIVTLEQKLKENGIDIDGDDDE